MTAKGPSTQTGIWAFPCFRFNLTLRGLNLTSRKSTSCKRHELPKWNSSLLDIFTARIRRMGKVMFSVCSHLGGGGGGGSGSKVNPAGVWWVGGVRVKGQSSWGGGGVRGGEVQPGGGVSGSKVNPARGGQGQRSIQPGWGGGGGGGSGQRSI